MKGQIEVMIEQGMAVMKTTLDALASSKWSRGRPLHVDLADARQGRRALGAIVCGTWMQQLTCVDRSKADVEVAQRGRPLFIQERTSATDGTVSGHKRPPCLQNWFDRLSTSSSGGAFAVRLHGAGQTLMKVGYARVSTEEQSLALQIDALRRAGCATIFRDAVVSGAKYSRPSLDRLLARVKPGDVLVTWRLDRLGTAFRTSSPKWTLAIPHDGRVCGVWAHSDKWANTSLDSDRSTLLSCSVPKPSIAAVDNGPFYCRISRLRGILPDFQAAGEMALLRGASTIVEQKPFAQGFAEDGVRIMRVLLGATIAAVIVMAGFGSGIAQAVLTLRYGNGSPPTQLASANTGPLFAAREGGPAVYGWLYVRPAVDDNGPSPTQR
jgi:hypothetical protein